MSRGNRGGGSPLSLFSLQDIITCLTGIMILLVLFLSVQTISETANVIVNDENIVPLDKVVESLEQDRNRLLALVNALAMQDHISGMSPVEHVRAMQVAQQEYASLSNAHKNVLSQQQEATQALLSVSAEVADKKKEVESLEKALENLKARAADSAKRKVAFIPDKDSTKSAHLIECSSNAVRVVSLTPPFRDAVWRPENAGKEFEAMMKVTTATRDFFVFMLKPSGVALGMNLYYMAKKEDYDAGYDTLEESGHVMRNSGP